MKNKFLLLPLLMLLLVACDPVLDPDDSSNSEPVVTDAITSDPTDTDTTTDPGLIEKDEIDPTELNAAVGFDVYALLPPIYSDDYEVSEDPSAKYPIDVYVDLYDWSLDDVYAYDDEMDLMLEYVGDGNYEIVENLYILVDYVGGAFVNIYSPAEAVEKDEIDPTELNAAVGFDVYALLPIIYSNDYLISDDSDENYPIDVYIDLFDWDDEDIESYDDALDSLFDYNFVYGYVIRENLFIFVTEEDNPFINIYSDAFYEPTPESSLWPAEVINEFFGSSEIGSLVPAFVSSSSFNYYIAGEDDYAQLIIYTEYPTIAGESIYVNALLDAGWIVDDSYYDLMGYDCWDAEEQISLLFYWQNGAMYWDFMAF